MGERRERTKVSMRGCGGFKAPSNDEREGDDMDFLRASQPGSLGGRAGHGVKGTGYPQVAEASSPGQELPTSGERLFLLNAPNMFFIVAPIEFLEFGTSWSLPEEGRASKHF